MRQANRTYRVGTTSTNHERGFPGHGRTAGTVESRRLMMRDSFEIVGKTLAGLEGVLAEELAALGARDIAPGVRLVSFRGDTRLLYRANLWCRTATRFLRPIRSFPATNE